MDNKLNVSFLPTIEDYVYMRLERLGLKTSKEIRMFFRIIGIIGFMGGAAGFLNLRENIVQIICWILLMIAGLYMLSYYDIIRPSVERNRAVRFFNYNKRNICSKNIKLENGVLTAADELSSIRLTGESIYSIEETKNNIFIFYDIENFIYIPKRSITEKQKQLILEMK